MIKSFFLLSLYLLFIGIEVYCFTALRSLVKSRSVLFSYIFIHLLAYAFLLWKIIELNQDNHNPRTLQWIMSVISVVIFPKLLALPFLFLDDLFRILRFFIQRISDSNVPYPSRRKFLTLLGIGTGGILSGLMLDGIVFGKFRHRVRQIRIRHHKIPTAFNGYRIIQISDVHSGSFANPEKLQKAIDLINNQKPDLVLFTGDMVNNYAEEFTPFVPLFASIRAKDGKYAVLGNHDYGIYGEFSTPEAQQRNVPNLISLQEQAGFINLRNRSVQIDRADESIYLIGVENWGLPPFPQYGDLDQATRDLNSKSFKILMSHDPSHFDAQILSHPSHPDLTLSGHTHGMQFGIDLKSFRWSPVQYRYPRWADLYKVGEQFLYVNRGFGVLGYPGRVGVNPEITLFILNSDK